MLQGGRRRWSDWSTIVLPAPKRVDKVQTVFSHGEIVIAASYSLFAEDLKAPIQVLNRETSRRAAAKACITRRHPESQEKDRKIQEVV
jgi:hypothetical protein